VALPFGVRVASGVAGFAVLVVLIALWAVVFSGFMQLIALKTRSAAATQAGSMVFFPLLFITPNFVPRDQLSRLMEIAASFNPVTYLMEAARSLVLDPTYQWEVLGKGFAVVAVAMALMVALSVRAINDYE
jgi:ABC-2 type transport system permease protein